MNSIGIYIINGQTLFDFLETSVERELEKHLEDLSSEEETDSSDDESSQESFGCSGVQ